MLRFSAFTLALLATAAHADDCASVLAAAAKTAATPNHQFITETSATRNGDKPTQSEVITTADRRYINVDGRWTSRAIDPKQEAADITAAAKDASPACSRVREETVDGQPAILYSEKTDAATTQVWIGQPSGTILKQTIDIDVGGKLGKSHRDLRFDYHDVSAPAM